jgi:hypothetical protein
MPVIQRSTIDSWMEERWAAELNRAVQLDIVIAALFRDRSGELREGDTLNIPASHHYSAVDKSATVDLTAEAIDEDAALQQFVVNTHKAWAVQIEDFAEIQSKYAIRSERTRDASYVLSRVMDVDASALLDDNTVQTVGVLGSELTEQNILDAREYLRESGFHGPYVAVVPPATYNGLLKTDRFTNQLYTGDAPGRAVNKAQVGALYEMTFYESVLLQGTSPNASGCVWKPGHFFKIVQRRPTPHIWYSPNALANIVTMDTVYGMFELQEANEAPGATTNARLGCVRLQCRK